MKRAESVDSKGIELNVLLQSRVSLYFDSEINVDEIIDCLLLLSAAIAQKVSK